MNPFLNSFSICLVLCLFIDLTSMPITADDIALDLIASTISGILAMLLTSKVR